MHGRYSISQTPVVIGSDYICEWRTISPTSVVIVTDCICRWKSILPTSAVICTVYICGWRSISQTTVVIGTDYIPVCRWRSISPTSVVIIPRDSGGGYSNSGRPSVTLSCLRDNFSKHGWIWIIFCMWRVIIIILDGILHGNIWSKDLGGNLSF